MWVSHVEWILPTLYFVGAGWAALTGDRPWRAVSVTTSSVLILQVGLAVGRWSLGLPHVTVPASVTAVALLVSFLGWVIGRYSAQYLEGECDQGRYATALLSTLGAVGAVIVSSHLGVMIASWSLTSVGLHHLLTFYSDRSSAIVVAHKKFLASRLAELCLAAAAVLIDRDCGSLNLDLIAEHARSLTSANGGITAAAVLLALGAIVKSAQLPLHGWLIQVMEAPTPVSALLHAGIVNLGGFVMIRLAALVSQVPAAQALLVIVGSLTAALAGLVMMTRISVKVRLAWSTCSQMGFMLMECGLGLYDLALLHLIAHSLYKAFAFLTAGEAVSASRQRAMLGSDRAARAGGAVSRVLSLPVAVAPVLGSAWTWQRVVHAPPIPLTALLLLAAGLATLLWVSGPGSGRLALRNGFLVLALVQLYLAWHFLAGRYFEPAPPAVIPTPIALWVGCCFASLYALQALVGGAPDSRFVRLLYPWVYAGFYLDERFTRLTFRLWPAKLRHESEASAEPRAAPAQGGGWP
ncbi:MAG: NADH-quinone oxidoreductase subunit L [Proteobacteria bacterium]|nr:NADH-quinone oxidoreductase subunit L [Pseudomonadota bacterium]